MLGELLDLNIFAFLLVFTRLGTAIALLPGYSASYVPTNIRLAFALVVTLAASPVLAPGLPVMPANVAALGMLLAHEFFIGAFFGVMGRILIGALQTAGTLMSLFASLANALIQDPIAEQQSSTLASFLSLVGIVMVFVTNTHHLMLAAVIDSYSLFDPVEPFIAGDFIEVLAKTLADSFALGLQLASPFLVIAMTYYTGLGMMTRLMPQLQVFFIGMPVHITVQIGAMALVLSAIMLVFLRHFEEGFTRFLAP